MRQSLQVIGLLSAVLHLDSISSVVSPQLSKTNLYLEKTEVGLQRSFPLHIMFNPHNGNHGVSFTLVEVTEVKITVKSHLA